jgi:glutamyl-tRNA synthetase
MTASARPVRVRIGPSPTGEPHVGTAYIALFNTAFAKKNGGKFVLRIEDTDQERSRREWEEQIMLGLRWLGLEWDEGPDKGGPYGPYRQSERTKIYQEHVQMLLDGGHAYRCFCTKERLDALRKRQVAAKVPNPGYDRHCRELDPATLEQSLAAKTPFVVRMKMPLSGETHVNDRLRPDAKPIPNASIDDQVLLKSDGFPTYHLANVVDDHLMQISHVIRAEEWIISTPKHLALYGMFGWEPPDFYHMPLLRNADTTKISKRKNPTSILDYKQRGFLPEALLNYLAMMGWSMPEGREMFSVKEFIDNFTFDRISLGGPVFDLAKLTALNAKYLRETLNDDQLAAMIQQHVFDREYVRQVAPLIHERISTLDEFISKTDYFFAGEVTIDPSELKPKNRPMADVKLLLDGHKKSDRVGLAEELDRLIDYSAPSIQALLVRFGDANGWEISELSKVLRVAVTGRTGGPGLWELMSVLGRARVRRRIRAAIEVATKAAATEPKAQGETKK